MDRKLAIDDLKKNHFDVLIIGGGINGAVSAASLSHLNYRVALIDQGDFASQTSQSSSNLVWGGIKYLENYEISLVKKLCHSRNQLMEAFPSLIREIRFFMPIIKNKKKASSKQTWKRHPFFIYIGMWFYWLLGRFYTKAPRRFSSSELASTNYPLNSPLFRGALEYSDAYLPENDARLVYRFIQQAKDNGATVVNYVQFKKQVKSKGEHLTFLVEDKKSKTTFNVQAHLVINAAGPFIDGINNKLSITTQHQHLFSKGVHLVFPKIFQDEKVISFFDEDNRLFFAIPMGNRTVVGTTDNIVEKPIANVTNEDREFLLRNINYFLTPDHQLSRQNIIAERCGVRPLVIKKTLKKNQSSIKNNWFQLSRKHSLDYSEKILSIFGGKLTDCINIGEEVVHEIQKRLPQPSQEKTKPHQGMWYGEETKSAHQDFLNSAQPYLKQFPQLEKFLPDWWARYGSNAKQIFSFLTKKDRMSEIFDSGYTIAELIYIIKNEQVVYLEDLIRRRTKLELIVKKSGLLKHPLIAKLIKEHKLRSTN